MEMEIANFAGLSQAGAPGNDPWVQDHANQRGQQRE